VIASRHEEEDSPGRRRAAIVHSLRYNLEKNGYACVDRGRRATAVALAQSERPDLVVLDIMLPLLDGIEACKEIRKTSTVPIIMLTAKDQEFDKVLALELGADDYVTKPFSLGEIMARIKARLRRVEVAAERAGTSRAPPARSRSTRHASGSWCATATCPSTQRVPPAPRPDEIAAASSLARCCSRRCGATIRGRASDDQRARSLASREDRGRSEQSAAHHHGAQPRLYVPRVTNSTSPLERWRASRRRRDLGRGPHREEPRPAAPRRDPAAPREPDDARVARLVGVLPFAAFTIDRRLRVRVFNAAAATLFGVDPSRAVGRAIIRTDHRVDLERMLAAALAGEISSRERHLRQRRPRTLRRRDGTAV